MSNVSRPDAGMIAKLDDWADLLARISHDLRTPLNAVIGFSDVMQRELFGPLGHSRYQEYARHIRQSGDELLRATENTLAMTALLTGHEPLRLDDLLLETLIGEAVAEQAVPASLLDCRLEVSLPQGLDVRGDPRLLPRAMRYVMTAAMARAVSGARIAIEAVASHGRIVLTVCVSPNSEPAPFLRHCSADAGLGRDDMALWLARGLLERHGNTVGTSSIGDEFRIELELERAMQPDFFPRM